MSSISESHLAVAGPMGRHRRERFMSSRTLGSVKRRQIKQGKGLLHEVDAGRACLKCDKCKDGFALHVWRKICRNCLCRREDHDIDAVVDSPSELPNKALHASQGPISQYEGRTRVGEEHDVRTGRKWRAPSVSSLASVAEDEGAEEDGDDAIVDENDSPYAWIPEGLTKAQIEKFMASLPLDARPENTPEGQQQRARRHLVQLPPHDMDAGACNKLDKEGDEALKAFVKGRDDRSMAQGVVAEATEVTSCGKCSQSINIGDMVVNSSRLPGKSFHPACFTCAECNEFLVDLVHFEKDGELYCGRHHAEKILPRCGGCDELIFKGNHTVAMGQKWHPDHFCCINCDRPLAAEKSEEFVKTDGNAVCLSCFEEKFAKMCLTCSNKIGAGEEQLSSDNSQWHMACFKCSACDVKLDANQFLMKEKSLFCASCYGSEFGGDCDKCKQPIAASDRSMGAGGKKWHATCFQCTGCKSSLAGKPFVNHDTGLFCVTCYESDLASRCKACNHPLGYVGGLRYKGDIYHPDCFVCAHCRNPLGGQKFVFKDDKFCCQTCYADKLAPKCKSCGKAIAKGSDSEDTYVSVQSNSWHAPCFNCVHCGDNLADQKFLYNNDGLQCGVCK